MKFFIRELEEGNGELLLAGKLDPEIYQIAELFPDEIKLRLNYSRFSQNVSVRIFIDATGHFACDRCLENFQRKLSEEIALFFRITNAGEFSDIDSEEDVVCLREDEKQHDLSEYVAEQLGLVIPIKNICKNDCKGLCSVCGADQNKAQCKCAREKIDPRLEQLEKFKNNLEGR